MWYTFLRFLLGDFRDWKKKKETTNFSMRAFYRLPLDFTLSCCMEDRREWISLRVCRQVGKIANERSVQQWQSRVIHELVHRFSKLNEWNQRIWKEMIVSLLRGIYKIAWRRSSPFFLPVTRYPWVISTSEMSTWKYPTKISCCFFFYFCGGSKYHF